jgi:phosphoglycolate phosphatase
MKILINQKLLCVDAVVFDKDGTLIGNTETWKYIFQCYMDTAGEMKLNIAKEAKRLFGFPQALSYSPLVTYYAKEGITLLAASIWLSHQKPWAECRDLASEIIKRSNARLDDTIVYHPNAGAVELIQKISTFVPVCIASSDNRENIQKMIHLLGIKDHITMIVTSDELEHGKPAPDILFHIADSLHVAPQKLLYIGDNEVDLQTAKNAQAKCILLNHPSEEADGTVDSLQELTNKITL